RLHDYVSAVTIGHSRYSTNTWSVFERVQPFTVLGHNGEINTIQRMRQEVRMLGAELVPGASDSQDINRVVEMLIHRFGFTLMEAMEIVFPPILHEVEQLSPGLQALHKYYRQAFGPYAQGPAGIVARYGDECAFSVDALGLRPLWFGETDKEYFFSSERGVVPLDIMISDPKPLAPGEKMVVRMHRDGEAEVLDYGAIQQRMLRLARRRFGSFEQLEAALQPPEPKRGTSSLVQRVPPSGGGKGMFRYGPSDLQERRDGYLAAFGWARDHREWLQHLAATGAEPIGSLGHDGPLAALDPELTNLADYFKEAVAVVTNPAIDREREAEHFSTQVIVGPRPSLRGDAGTQRGRLVLDVPIVLGGHPGKPLLNPVRYGKVAQAVGTATLEDMLAAFGEAAVCRLDCTFAEGETIPDALHRLSQQAIKAVQDGAEVVLLDDGQSWQQGRYWLDPHAVVAAIDRALRERGVEAENLRRQCGLVLRSGAIRNLHDLILALGFGADAVNPYLMLEFAVDPGLQLIEDDRAMRLVNLLSALTKGLEKVTSTMGIHELRGYGRVFAAIGLSEGVASALEVANYCGSTERGLTWGRMADDSRRRAGLLRSKRPMLARTHHILPKIWKVASRVSRGLADDTEMFQHIGNWERKQPVALRHLLEFNFPSDIPRIRVGEVDAGLTGHDLPFVIASMSFGSQNETAFRAYAEAAYRLNIIALNGEGGEPADMLGKYPHNRGQQIASGRFGVNIELLNSSNLLEIKIGQGAKPGEGGHLPGRKVSAKVAAARHATKGVDLISPSNNHDIYSIEDLAQFIEELKTANPKARVAVKLPVVPGIGIIAVGVAKAKADIINLTGFDGGTGAARKHAIRYVGLPAEIGVVESHRALIQAGLRDQVEIWCDGGIRSATDVMKMICLGANRVGFGTMAMIAIGCTVCRSCQTDTCHMGIATQIESVEEAQARGLKRFEPQDYEQAVERLVTFFSAIGQEVKQITARLGFRRTQDLVGRVDLLRQVRLLEKVDLTEMLEPVLSAPQRSLGGVAISRPLRRPRNHLTTMITELVMGAVESGDQAVAFEDDRVGAADRALGTHLSGQLIRFEREWEWPERHSEASRAYAHGSPDGTYRPRHGQSVPSLFAPPLAMASAEERRRRPQALLHFHSSSIPGNGLGAFNAENVEILVEGGAQDGVAKGAYGGKVMVMKGLNHDGERVDGSVGKFFAYGAIRGRLIVQGNADSRACIRLSGADVVIGGQIKEPIRDHLGFIGSRANVKGFLCEYMTAGRVVVLGDPGPWICSGMTGGVLYLRLNERMGLDRDAIRRRLAKGAKVTLMDVDEQDEANLRELLGFYMDELTRNLQPDEAEQVRELLANWREVFVKIVPLQ
ncbi:MAG TPA: glutamate synthase, partial [Anaerolineae bacterium]|nr:glutamate synthase [Anaerolineae bacterium]